MPNDREEYRDAAERRREDAELFRRQAEEGRQIAEGYRAREVLAEPTELARRMRVATEAQEALVEEFRQRRSS